MRRFGLKLKAFFAAVTVGAFGLLTALPGFAQPDSAVTQSSSGTSATTTTTTTTTTDWISDWRLWAVVGAVVLVILVIALTRGKGDSTTIVK